MKLYIGGYAQGKLSYVREKHKIGQDDLIADGEYCEKEEALQKPVINRFHLLVKRLMEEEAGIADLAEELLQKNPEVIIICDEVGMGIVPMEKKDRDYRETVGRTLCELAKRADSVERIICGIGQKLC